MAAASLVTYGRDPIFRQSVLNLQRVEVDVWIVEIRRVAVNVRSATAGSDDGQVGCRIESESQSGVPRKTQGVSRVRSQRVLDGRIDRSPGTSAAESVVGDERRIVARVIE